MYSWLLRRTYLLLLPLALFVAPRPVIGQQTAAEIEEFQTKLDAVANSLANYPRYKGTSLQFRRQLAEFVSGNVLFVLLHEMAHVLVSEFALPVLGREEDAADSYAATRLIRMGTSFSDRVLTEAAKGWFMADLRDKKEGDTVPYYDEHGLNQVRAYQIVCFMVGADKERFRELAREKKLPEERQVSCARDYNRASYSWDLVAKPHLRTPDQPKTKIEVTYGDGKGRAEIAAQSFRYMKILEVVADAVSDRLAWPAPFTLEMKRCGFVNARWAEAERTLSVCYELAADFADLYRSYGNVPTESRKRKFK